MYEDKVTFVWTLLDWNKYSFNAGREHRVSTILSRILETFSVSIIHKVHRTEEYFLMNK